MNEILYISGIIESTKKGLLLIIIIINSRLYFLD